MNTRILGIVNGPIGRFSKAHCWGTVCRGLILILAALITFPMRDTLPEAFAQSAIARATIQGTVMNFDRSAASSASVRLEDEADHHAIETNTAATGAFEFSGLKPGSYVLTAEKAGVRSRPASLVISSQVETSRIELVLADSQKTTRIRSLHPPSSSPAEAMEFADKPSFTVAGVTDWTAVGGHGSDSILRTSEDLARETLTLKDQSPNSPASDHPAINANSDKSERELRAALTISPESVEANRQLGKFYLHQKRYTESISLLEIADRVAPRDPEIEYDLVLALQESGHYSQAKEKVQALLATTPDANLHRIAGEIEEKLANPLSAVHEYEEAARMDPSEQNYFEWGSELLLHRAVWQAQEVFEQGTKAYPRSARMLTALGSALFAGALYDQAAQRLCDASDLDTASSEPYIFMGKIAQASPKPLACIEQRLARFAQQEPNSSLANYLYAMAIWKRQAQPPDPQALHQVETLLNNAVKLDPHCADGYLQLGVLSASQRDLEKAIDFYKNAIQVNPQLGEAHYRLGVAYDRRGDSAKARAEFQQHDDLERKEADAIEQQRREVKQFLVVLYADPKKQDIH